MAGYYGIASIRLYSEEWTPTAELSTGGTLRAAASQPPYSCPPGNLCVVTPHQWQYLGPVDFTSVGVSIAQTPLPGSLGCPDKQPKGTQGGWGRPSGTRGGWGHPSLYRH